MTVESRIEREARPLSKGCLLRVGEEEEEEEASSTGATAAAALPSTPPPPPVFPVPLRLIAAGGSISSRSLERVESGRVFIRSGHGCVGRFRRQAEGLIALLTMK